MEDYTNLVEALEGLRKQGYTEDFNLQPNYLECKAHSRQLSPHEFQIDKTFRFDGDTDPTDESILYAISSDVYNLKGVLVNGYGLSSDPVTDEMLTKLS